ncbi:hypothetical protein GDO86_016508, partial [Hymenochirus boettgeri]
ASPAAKPSPGTPTTPTNLASGLKTPVQVPPNPLANILSKVEITPESILSALSKTQGPATPLQGLSSLIQSVAVSTALSSGALTHSTSTAPVGTTVPHMKDRNASSVTAPFVSKNVSYSPTPANSEVSTTPVCKPSVAVSSNVKQTPSSLGFASQAPLSAEKNLNQSSEISKPAGANESSSLEMKIHNFLKGNPGFSGLDLNIPILSGIGSNAVSETAAEYQRGPANTSLDNVDGTPVRDERSGTPTQDEMMDKPASSSVDTVSLLSKIISPGSSTPSSTRSPLLSKDSDFQKLINMPAFRPFGLGSNSPSAYMQPADNMVNPPLMDYPDTASFQEDEDYRDFDYSAPPPSAMGNIEKRTSKSNVQPVPNMFSQSQDFGRQSFPPSLRNVFNSGESSGHLSPSSQLYENYSSLSNVEAKKSPLTKDDPFFTPKDDGFFPSDTNHNLPGMHSGLSQTPYSDTHHVLQNRSHSFTSNNNTSSTVCRTSLTEQTSSTVSASTIEFKNMLKNASRRPSEESQFSQLSKSNFHEDMKMSGRAGLTSEERQLQEENYRIETRVSSSGVELPESAAEEKGAPIETLGYHNSVNIRISGEPIKTVESLRVGVKGNRGLGVDGGRGGWYNMGSTGSSFDDGPSNPEEPPSISGGFETQYDEHLPQFQDTGDFRTKPMQPFEHHIPPPHPPPPMVAPLDRGGPFQIDQMGMPSVPPPGLPPDHFPRDISVPPHMPPIEPPSILPHGAHPPEHGGNLFSGPPSRDQIGIPFSSPPPLDMRNPFAQDHSNIRQGAMEERFGIHTGPPRDHGALSLDHNGPPHGRVNEILPPHSRDHHGNFSGPPHSGPQHHFNAQHHRDNVGGPRPHRPHFRPREPYQSLKRPRPPFGRGSQFFSPKRPFYPPRY